MDWTTEIRKAECHLEDRVRSLEVRQSLVEERTNTMGQDVKEIKDTLKWINRLALGAVVASILNLIINTGG